MPEIAKRICKKKLSKSRLLAFRISFGQSIPFFLLVSAIFLSSCTSSSTRRESPQGKQLMKQVQISSGQLTEYTKSFQDLQNPEKEAEILPMSLPSSGVDSVRSQLEQDLAYLFDVYYKDESLIEYLDTTFVGDTLIAKVKEGKEKKSKLRVQKILKDNKGNYRYISTQTHTSTWLYSLDISVWAKFDSTSRYEQHQLYLKNKVNYLDESIESFITGKASYQE